MTSGNITHNNPGAYCEPSGGPTGDATVDQALRTLDGLEGRPIHEHAAVVEGVHQALQERLADEPIDDHPADGQV
ncbi:hypothetical protein F7O44_28785 [Phytoactinopolyspora sp. XMNu-373]|uniref:Uncharacterized protein n=2 Tax=Phytoactinopolyspora mesophila TaxID=2650750 RepID=A0A7K3MDJ6_9ACTN|nr:hypothetical protein [Phytoactinopolyspora mesophila]